MENKQRVLGKGLSALIPEISSLEISNENRPSSSIISSLEINSGNIFQVKTSQIKDNRLQPRQNYDEARLEDLKASIKDKGILQPILVRKSGDGYEVVAGERRLRAARALNLAEVPVIVKNVTDREALVLALVENIQREELNAIEEAQGFKRLLEEFQFTQEAVAESVGKDRTTITNLLRLLRLPTEIQNLIAADKISMGHARALLGLENNQQQQKMAKEIVAKSLSVRQVEAMVKKAQEASEPKQKTTTPKQRDLEILEEEIQRQVGSKVKIQDNNGKGKIIIEYYSLNDFDRILRILRK